MHTFVCCTEDPQQLPGQQFRNQHGAHPQQGFRSQQPDKKLLYPVFAPGSHVISYQRNTPCRHADRYGHHDLKHLHNNAHHRQRNMSIKCLPENSILRSVLPEHIVGSCHGGYQRDLSQEAAQTQTQGAARNRPVRPESILRQTDSLHAA